MKRRKGGYIRRVGVRKKKEGVIYFNLINNKWIKRYFAKPTIDISQKIISNVIYEKCMTK